MRSGLVLGAVIGTVSAMCGSAGAAPRAALAARPASCTTSVVFGTPEWFAKTMRFRATVDISCPIGVAFSAELRSANACELRSSSGVALQYEIFSDSSLQSAVVSCERGTQPLRGTGRAQFIVYGRIDSPVSAIGSFNDALLTTITL